MVQSRHNPPPLIKKSLDIGRRIVLERATNGFILHPNFSYPSNEMRAIDDKYIFKNVDELAEFLKKHYQPQNEPDNI